MVYRKHSAFSYFYWSIVMWYTQAMSRKNTIAIIFIVIAILGYLFPTWARSGLYTLFSDTSNAQIGLLDMMVFLTAIILFFIPEKNK